MAGSSSKTSCKNFDVFISHRGLEMKRGFADCLYHALEKRGIACFLDAETLPIGEDVRKHMLAEVRKAKIQVPIFTQIYGTSNWCLDELAEMMDRKSKGLSEVCPIFFDVKPEDLRNQKGRFAENFEKWLKGYKCGQQQIDRWKQALEGASWIAGFRLESYGGFQGALIDAIGAYILNSLAPYLPVDKGTNLVGLDSKVEEVMQLVRETNAFLILICGMGGVGKTTLAREIRRRRCCEFEVTSFVKVKLCSSKDQIQERLLKDLFGDSSDSSRHICGRARLQSRIREKKVLVVFDGVKDSGFIEELISPGQCLPSESLIVVTSRNKNVFPNNKAFRVAVYELPTMDDDESQELFYHHAGTSPDANAGFQTQAKEIVKACAGLPLALEVLGRHIRLVVLGRDLRSMTIRWLEAVKKLEANTFKAISGRLREDFEDLDAEEQGIFQDVACFLVGEYEWRAKYFWDASGACSETGLQRLVDLSLVNVDKDKRLTMHDLLRALGREISSETRLCTEKALQKLLKKEQGLEGVLGIATSLSCLDASRLSKLSSLRLLFLDGTELTGTEMGLRGPELLWLNWKRCPHETLPAHLWVKSLAVLQLEFTKRVDVRFPSSITVLQNLRDLDIWMDRPRPSVLEEEEFTSVELSVRLAGFSFNLLSSFVELKRPWALRIRKDVGHITAMKRPLALCILEHVDVDHILNGVLASCGQLKEVRFS